MVTLAESSVLGRIHGRVLHRSRRPDNLLRHEGQPNGLHAGSVPAHLPKPSQLVGTLAGTAGGPARGACW